MCLLSSQRIHITRAHKTRTSKKYMCAQSALIDECKKWASHIFSRLRVKAKGERSILYLICHLFTRLSGSRVIAHSKKNHNELSLDGKRGSRATTFIRATGNTILLSSFCVRLFFFRLQSAEDGCERDKVGSDTQCANPNVLSKISLDREKKKREDFKRKTMTFFTRS